MFLFKLVIDLSENININKYAIKLKDSKQLFYKPIYSLRLIKLLETLKIYIKTHLKIGFIELFKFLADVHILFDKKPDSILYPYVDY